MADGYKRLVSCVGSFCFVAERLRVCLFCVVAKLLLSSQWVQRKGHWLDSTNFSSP